MPDLKNDKVFSHNKRCMKTLNRVEKMKNEKYKKSLTTSQRQQNYLLIFLVYGKGYILLRNIVWENLMENHFLCNNN